MECQVLLETQTLQIGERGSIDSIPSVSSLTDSDEMHRQNPKYHSNSSQSESDWNECSCSDDTSLCKMDTIEQTPGSDCLLESDDTTNIVAFMDLNKNSTTVGPGSEYNALSLQWNHEKMTSICQDSKDGWSVEKHPDVNEKMRHILYSWMFSVVHKFKVQHETYFESMQLMDYFMAKCKKSIPRGQLQKYGLVCLWISCKNNEIYPPPLRDFVYICDRAYPKQEFIEGEIFVLRQVSGRIQIKTCFSFWPWMMQVALEDCRQQYENAKENAKRETQKQHFVFSNKETQDAYNAISSMTDQVTMASNLLNGITEKIPKGGKKNIEPKIVYMTRKRTLEMQRAQETEDNKNSRSEFTRIINDHGSANHDHLSCRKNNKNEAENVTSFRDGTHQEQILVPTEIKNLESINELLFLIASCGWMNYSFCQTYSPHLVALSSLYLLYDWFDYEWPTSTKYSGFTYESKTVYSMDDVIKCFKDLEPRVIEKILVNEPNPNSCNDIYLFVSKPETVSKFPIIEKLVDICKSKRTLN